MGMGNDAIDIILYSNNDFEVADSTCAESQAEQCIIVLLTTLLTTYYEGETSTIPGNKIIPNERYSELQDIRSIITRDIRLMQLEYQIAKKIMRAGMNVEFNRNANTQMHPCETKLMICLVILVGNRPSLPEGLIPKTLLTAANAETRGEPVYKNIIIDDSAKEDRTNFGALEYIFDEVQRPQDFTWLKSTTLPKPAKKISTTVESQYYAKRCFDTYRGILSDWLHAEVKHHIKGSSSGYTGISLFPRRVAYLNGGHLGFPSFSITLLDNGNSVISSDSIIATRDDNTHEHSEDEVKEPAKISVQSSVTLAELELLGSDIPLEAILIGFKELAIGSASDGHPGGYFSEK